MLKENILNVAIIGLGHLHPRSYMPLFENCNNTRVVAAYDENAELVGNFCKDFGIRSYHELNAILENEKIDIAAIFLPHSEAGQAAIKCARKGIHIMVEKPVTATSQQAEEVSKAVADNHVKATTGYCWRYHPVIKKMKECINLGYIGDVVSVEARLAAGKVDRYIKGNSSWMLEKAKSGGGPLYNLGVHWIDTLCYVLDDKISRVCAVNTKTSDEYDIEDNSISMLQFHSGIVGVLSTSYIVPDCFPSGRDLYLGIKGTKGVLSFAPGYEGEKGSSGEGQTDILELYSDSEKVAGASARHFIFKLDKVEGYSGYLGKAYVEEFVDAIINDNQPFITMEQAIEVLDVVEAIYKSDEASTWINV